MDQLTSLRVFAAVAASLSFSQGANRLGLSPAMASKHIQRLEARVGARLFHRNSRNVSLTEAGAEYLKSVDPLLQGLDEAEAQLSNITNEAKGTLRLTLPVWMANPRFARFLTAYTEAHPGVELDADLTGRRINLVEDGFDLALRVSQSLEEDLIARKVGDVSFLLVAAPAFLDRIGRPASAAHLNGAPFLVYAEVADNGRIRFGSGDRRLGHHDAPGSEKRQRNPDLSGSPRRDGLCVPAGLAGGRRCRCGPVGTGLTRRRPTHRSALCRLRQSTFPACQGPQFSGFFSHAA